MTAVHILAASGSSRTGSFNRAALAAAVAGARAAGATVETVDLRELALPLYDGDLEATEGLPAGATRLKALLRAADGLILACPEYNGSITPLLKNAIDWASRPVEGEAQPFSGLAAGLVSASGGALGGLRGLVHVRQILTNLGVVVAPQQRALGGIAEHLDDDGALRPGEAFDSLAAIGERTAALAERLRG